MPRVAIRVVVFIVRVVVMVVGCVRGSGEEGFCVVLSDHCDSGLETRALAGRTRKCEEGGVCEAHFEGGCVVAFIASNVSKRRREEELYAPAFCGDVQIPLSVNVRASGEGAVRGGSEYDCGGQGSSVHDKALRWSVG